MNHQFGGIYSGQRVLVTGHTGFKGSWLCLWLKELGADVVGYAKDIPTEPNHFQLLKLDMPSVMADVRDREKLRDTITRHRPSIVFHLAAQALVRDSYDRPVETFETNVLGTVNVLESCRQTGGVKAIVNVTSDKCYRNDESDRAYVESDPLGGRDPYSASKAGAEIVANAYRESFFSPGSHQDHAILLANARAGNVVGGGDWAKDRLIPDIVRAAAARKPVTIRHPRSTRPWQHALEPISGYLLLGWRLLEGRRGFAEDWNFGPPLGHSLTVTEVLKHAKRYWRDVPVDLQSSESGANEAKTLSLDATKARTRLGWKSLWDGEKMFRATMNWYKRYYESHELTSADDIREYTDDAQRAELAWTKV